MTPVNLCFGCFSAPRTDGPCAACGYEHDRDAFPTALPSGDVLSRYVLGRVLGKPGGFGITYLAFDPLLHRRLAVKELMPRDLVARRQDGRTLQVHTRSDASIFADTLQSFLNEARLIAQINHPNIVRVVDFFEANGTAYFAMDYYQGETLSQYLARSGGRLSGPEATSLMLPVLGALEHLHSMPEPILHRDIKPANIYLTDRRTPILLDFGAARVRLGVSRSLSTVLTPGFAPYEQYSTRGNQGPWSDVYACAATLYFLVTGRVPPEASERIDHPDIEDPCRLAPGLSRQLGDAILRGLGFRPEDRPRTAREFMNALAGDIPTQPGRAVAAGIPAVAPADRPTEPAPAGSRAAAPAQPSAAGAATVLSPATGQPDAPTRPGPALWAWAGGSLAVLLLAALALGQLRGGDAPAQSAAAVSPRNSAPATQVEGGVGSTAAVPLSQDANAQTAPRIQQLTPAAPPDDQPTPGTSAAAAASGASAATAPSAGQPSGRAAAAAPAASPTTPGAPTTSGAPSARGPSPVAGQGAAANAVAAAGTAAQAAAPAAAPAPAGTGVFVTVYGSDSNDALIVETTLLRGLAGRSGLRPMDQAALSMARGDDAAVAAANRGDFGALARLGREQGAEVLIVCDLAARAVPSVGGFHTGTAELTMRMYQVSTSALLGFDTFRVGPGGAQAILALGESEARSRATQAAADLAVRAAGNWLAGAAVR